MDLSEAIDRKKSKKISDFAQNWIFFTELRVK